MVQAPFPHVFPILMEDPASFLCRQLVSVTLNMSVGIATIAALMVMIKSVADHSGRHSHNQVGQGPGIHLPPKVRVPVPVVARVPGTGGCTSARSV